MDFGQFKADHNAENEGVWVDLSSTAKAKIARVGNKKYLEALRSKYKLHRFELDQDDDESQALQEKIAIELYANYILLDWSGMTENGVEVPYSPAEALRQLKNKDFFNRIKPHAENFEHFRLKAEETAAKN